MARHRSSPTKKRERSLREGRGSGRGKDYKPHLQVREVPSHGRSTQIRGKVSGRTHQLLSDNERSVLLSLDNAIGVTDIREQVPLDLKTTIEIAANAGIPHPKQKNELVDLTTDFIVDVKSSKGSVVLAIAVKSASDLCNARVIEKLEIERRYWENRGVSWQISTDREMSPERKKHDLWLCDWDTLDDLQEPRKGYWARIKQDLINTLETHPARPLRELIKDFDEAYSIKRGHCLAMIRHLLAAKVIRLQRRHFIDYGDRADQLKICTQLKSVSIADHF